MAERVLLPSAPLARAATSEPPARGAAEVLVFRVGEELFGAHIEGVREIVAPPPVTPVPGAGGRILGVCSVRGRLATVVDLAACLGVARGASGGMRRLLVAESREGELLAFAVAEVLDVARLERDPFELGERPTGTEGEPWLGVVQLGGRLVALIELGRVLLDARDGGGGLRGG